MIWERKKSLKSTLVQGGVGVQPSCRCRKLPPFSCKSCLGFKLPSRLCCPKRDRRMGSGCSSAAPSDTRCSHLHLLSPVQTHRPLKTPKCSPPAPWRLPPWALCSRSARLPKPISALGHVSPWSPESHFPRRTRSCSCNQPPGLICSKSP